MKMQSQNPYLNTYNYNYPVDHYQGNQMPDSRYETGSYDNSYMPYGNDYDNADIPYGNNYDDDGRQYSFREGGTVQEELPRLAELIRQKGRNGDTELAHINPIGPTLNERVKSEILISTPYL